MTEVIVLGDMQDTISKNMRQYHLLDFGRQALEGKGGRGIVVQAVNRQ